MHEACTYGFLDELDKIAARKGVSSAILAHELGHARDYEGSVSPTLRMTVRSLAPVVGGLTAAFAAKTPGAAALASGAGILPLLADEASASFKAISALKKSKNMSEADVSRAKKQLLMAGGTYAALAAGAVGTAAAAKATASPVAFLPILSGAIGSAVLGNVLRKDLNKRGKNLGDRDAQGLRKQMGVKAAIHKIKGPTTGAAFVPGLKGPMKSLNRLMLRRAVGKNKARKISQEGGVIIPTG